jgi:outer membrane protein OmpA-like peptidoglycan-associated protein
VELVGSHIEIHQKIQFEVGNAVIKSESFGLLGEIADVIKKNPQVKKISIEGHSSSEGDAAMNMKLSEERAKSVRTYLVDKGGVKADSLVSKGFGVTKPIASNDTQEGKEKNRRVEFVVVDPPATTAAVAPATPATPATPAKPGTMKLPKAGKAK